MVEYRIELVQVDDAKRLNELAAEGWIVDKIMNFSKEEGKNKARICFRRPSIIRWEYRIELVQVDDAKRLNEFAAEEWKVGKIIDFYKEKGISKARICFRRPLTNSSLK